MSRDWNVHCVDCNATHTFYDANHEDELMLSLCRHATAIAGVAALLRENRDLKLKTPWGEIDADWFREHQGHNLKPIDEYGQLENQCRERVNCECGFGRDCVLDTGHEGPHKTGPRRRH